MTDTIESSENSTASTPLRMSTHEGLGPDIVVSSPSTPRRSIYQQQSSPAAIKKQLEDQLNEKANQIQMTAELGQALVKQQSELEQRIRELDQTEGDEVPQDLKDKLTELEKQANALEASTAKVFLGTKGLSSGGIDLAGSTGSPSPSATSLADSVPTTTTTGRLSRREMNKQKNRKNDIEFAAEIGQGLLVEVRKLQALRQEKEDRIKELESDKAGLERIIEMLTKQIREKEESEERVKDENWKLELLKQDMANQIDDLQQQLNKARNEYSKVEKALATATDVIEQLKDKEERLTTDYLNLKTRHDKDMANNRRHVAALNREKNDLMKNLEDVNAQLASLQATRNMRKRTPEPGASPGDVYTDEFGQPFPNNNNNVSNEGIPAALQGKNLNIEVETLKALGYAKRMIGSLRANIQKEKSEKYELKKLLADSQEQIEAMRYEEEFADPNKRTKKSKRSKRSSTASNGLPNIGENDSQDDSVEEDDEVINKNNRPSSDMFRPRGWKPRKSRGSARSSIMSSRIDEDITGDDDDETEDDETVATQRAAQRAEALNNLTNRPSKSQLSKQVLVEDPDEYSDSGDADSKPTRSSVVQRRISQYEDISGKTGTHERKSSKDKIETNEDDASSVDSFTSANETNDSKRGSAASKRESAVSKRNSKRGSKREYSMPLSSISSSIKEFKHAAVQTDDVERSDSLSTTHTGKYTFGNRDTVYDNALRDLKDDSNTRQSILSAHEDNNIDKRFTLDLSHGKNMRNQQGQSRGLDPPPRPTNSPPPALIAQAYRSTSNFGQQAGSSKIPHNPINLGRKRSIDSQDNIQINNPRLNGAIPTSNHKHTLSSGSVSTVSSTASAENIGVSDSSQAEASNSIGPITGPMTGPSGTDPGIIHAITQTMIGEYLWKYTRKSFGGGTSEKRHKRFFWVHPYTKTLYWGNRDPGSYEPEDPKSRDSKSKDPKSKSGMSYFAYIESVKQVVDHNPSPPGLHHMSLVIKTPDRELKFTARSKERHEYWFQALSYLLQRPDEVGQVGQGQTPGRYTRNGSDPWETQANMQNLHSNTSPNGTLKGSNLREVKKKTSFNKLQSIFRRDGLSSSSTSPLSTEFVDGQYQTRAIPGSSIINNNNDVDDLEDFENMENVRQCCDGRHDVSTLERSPHKHHHH